MYEHEPTADALVRARSPQYWDAAAGELTAADPDDHTPDGFDPAGQGWDDPARAAGLLAATVIEDARLVPLAETPTTRPRVLTPAEALTEAAPGAHQALLDEVHELLGTGPVGVRAA